MIVKVSSYSLSVFTFKRRLFFYSLFSSSILWIAYKAFYCNNRKVDDGGNEGGDNVDNNNNNSIDNNNIDNNNINSINKSNKSNRKKPVTLLNRTGTLCYANAILQAILPFRNHFPPSMKSLKDFLLRMHTENGCIDPLSIVMELQHTTPTLRELVQHDASEFLEAILSEAASSGDTTNLNFTGEIITKIHCNSCLSARYTRQPFTVLHLPGLSTSLEGLLDELMEVEELSNYRCESCGVGKESFAKITTYKTASSSAKQSTFSKLPKVLSIQLPRTTVFAQKTMAAITFGDHPIRIGATDYALLSIVCHAGTTGAGHYTCYRRCQNDDDGGGANYNDAWTLISDSSYKEGLKWDSITRTLEKDAYILFFSSMI